jgi:ABC-2 type transport system ATP-binding protein
MVWFCGGHGVCLTGAGPAGHVERDVIAWLRRYVAGDRAVRTGPGFEWIADDARWRSARAWPPRRGRPLTGRGSGTLAVNPADALSGTPIAAAPAANAVNVPIRARRALVAGRPRLRLTYSATGTGQGYVFAQVVDLTRGLAVGNQVAPIRIRLDGARHEITRRLNAVAARSTRSSRYALQIIGGSQVFGAVRTTAVVQMHDARISLPTVRRR